MNDGGPVELKVIAVDSLGASTSAKFTVTVDANLFPWHNAANPFDTNATGKVSPADALIVINYLNSGASRIVLRGSAPTFGFLDTSKDNQITPLDALLVINELNRRANGEGEAIAAQELLPAQSAVAQDLVWNYMQQMDDRKRQEELVEILAGEARP